MKGWIAGGRVGVISPPPYYNLRIYTPPFCMPITPCVYRVLWVPIPTPYPPLPIPTCRPIHYFTIYLLGICAIALPFLLLASSTKACDITEKAWVPTSEVLSCHVKSCYRMLSKPLTWVFMNTTTGLGRALLYCIHRTLKRFLSKDLKRYTGTTVHAGRE